MTVRQSLRKKLMENKSSANNWKIDKYGDKLKLEVCDGFNLPAPEYKTHVKDYLTEILMHEGMISEKDFSRVDDTIAKVKKFFQENPKASIVIDECESQGHRYQYTAERIYNEFKSALL